MHTCCAACAAVCSGADECMLCKFLSRSLLATLLLSIQKVLLLPLLACLQTYPFMSACCVRADAVDSARFLVSTITSQQQHIVTSAICANFISIPVGTQAAHPMAVQQLTTGQITATYTTTADANCYCCCCPVLACPLLLPSPISAAASGMSAISCGTSPPAVPATSGRCGYGGSLNCRTASCTSSSSALPPYCLGST